MFNTITKMKKHLTNYSFLILLFSIFTGISLQAQNATLTSKILDGKSQAVEFATIALKSAIDSTLINVEMTDENGIFTIQNIKPADYLLEITYVGLADFRKLITVSQGNNDLGSLNMDAGNQQIEEVTVTAQRSMIEAKSDRMVFNVQGTINSAGENLLNLLRKAPGVLVDNNDNISVLSRAGVLIYVDGKRLPLSGADLTAYLQSLPAEQVDHIDIITNPGAKYEAEGNAGIIDIILKRDKNQGANGSLSGSLSRGRFTTGNISGTGNYRGKKFNTFFSGGYNGGTNWNNMNFGNDQNGLLINEVNNFYSDFNNFNVRVGTDFFISPKSTIGFLVTGQNSNISQSSRNRSEIGAKNAAKIDSILRSDNTSLVDRVQRTYNLNYAYRNGEKTVNVDLDLGNYNNDSDNFQPNRYYNAAETQIISEYNNHYLTPVTIDIATAKVDVELPLMKGKFGFGSKYSQVVTDNTFLFNNILDGVDVLNNRRSNNFKYNEEVAAAYANYNKTLSPLIDITMGVRLENTNSTGDLRAFLPELQEDPVKFNYLSYFPSAGFTFKKNPEHVYSFNYGRRINRPDYNVLNPFREQITELSFSKGNPFLRPEIVNNLEFSYTLKYRFNFSLAFSKTNDQITRLIGPDDTDPRAGFITYANLANQKIYSFNSSIPLDVTKWWNLYFNAAFSYTDNQADYGNGAVVDVQVFNYNFYQQQVFSLPNKWKFEVSGWYSGPGVWGGVFLYESQYSLNLGLQRKFINDKMNVKLAVSDVTFKSGWNGYSNFNGLIGTGSGNYDSRRATLSVSYELGNKNVKTRNRETGLETEAKRVGG